MEVIPTDFRIKQILKEKGLTQQDLANRMGVSLPAIKQMLSAESLTTSTLQKIAKSLDVEIWELFVAKEKTSQATLICPHCGKPISVCLEKD